MLNEIESKFGHRLDVGELQGIPTKLAKTLNQQLTKTGSVIIL